ncbi:hypothetical protein MRX96_008757 [Rhipicephalus microplus]
MCHASGVFFLVERGGYGAPWGHPVAARRVSTHGSPNKLASSAWLTLAAAQRKEKEERVASEHSLRVCAWHALTEAGGARAVAWSTHAPRRPLAATLPQQLFLGLPPANVALNGCR